MGRGRGKAKRNQSGDDAAGSGEEDKLGMKRRGRPQKSAKDEEIDEEETVEKASEKEEEVIIFRKRKRASSSSSETKDTDKNNSNNHSNATAASAATTSDVTVMKNVGYRPTGSRRKSKPRRAAEVGVECN